MAFRRRHRSAAGLESVIEDVAARPEPTIGELAGRRASGLDDYREAVEHLRELARDSEQDRERYEDAVGRLFVDELTHPDLIAIAREAGQPLVHADSFWRSLVVRRRKKQLGFVPEKHLGITKEKDRQFAELLGVDAPAILFTGPFDEIPAGLRENVVVKPVNASDSMGAFYVFAPDDIFSIAVSEWLSSWDAMVRTAIEQLGTDSPDEVRWQVQELVLGADGQPARDLKFYAFYGQIGLILEASRYPVREYAYFDEDLVEAACGKDHEPRFRDTSHTTVDRGALTPQRLHTVKRISEAIPVPFMRIDFLNAPHELKFCEFSSAPGMSHTLSSEYDERLGRYYHEAEIRLVNDLLRGKRFEAFERFSPHSRVT